MTHCDDNGHFLNSFQAKNLFEAGWNVAANWTYAPGQFALGSLLLHNHRHWETFLFYLRFPSALSSVIAFVLLNWLFHRRYPKNSLSNSILAPRYEALIALAIFAASVSNLMHSQQGYPYTVVLPFIIGLALLLTLSDNFLSSQTRYLCAYLAIVLLGFSAVWFSYQLIVPIFLAAFLFFCRTMLSNLITKPQKIKFTVSAVVSTAVIGYLFINPLYQGFIKHHIGRGSNIAFWVTGDAPTYPTEQGVFTVLRYLAEYVPQLFYKIFFYNLTPQMPRVAGDLAGTFIGFVCFIALITSVVSVFRAFKNWRQLKPLVWVDAYFVLYAVALICFNLLRIFPLGSSRHSQVILPSILYLSYLGFLSMSDFFRRKAHNWQVFKYVESHKEVFSIGLALSVLTLFWVAYPSYLHKTENNISMTWVIDQIAPHNLKEIAGVHCTFDAAIAANSIQSEQLKNIRVIHEMWAPEQFQQVLERLQKEPIGSSALFISHRKDLAELVVPVLSKFPNMQGRRLLRREPIGSNELVHQNGGNGGFAYMVSNVASPPVQLP